MFICWCETTIPVYMPHIDPLQSIMCPWTLVTIHSTLLEYAPEHIHATLYICIPLHSYHSLHIGPILLHMEVNKNKLLFTMLLSYMWKQQIFQSNATYANQLMCRYQTTMSRHIPHMNSLQSTMSPHAPVYIHFTLPLYSPEQVLNKVLQGSE